MGRVKLKFPADNPLVADSCAGTLLLFLGGVPQGGGG